MTTDSDNDPMISENDAQAQALWAALDDLPKSDPSPRLRQAFYAQLEKAQAPGVIEQVMSWLGFRSHAGWLTAASCLLLGAGAALIVTNPEQNDTSRLAELEYSVARLNRELVLDRLQDAQPGQRLRGVLDAGNLAGSDPDVANALLVTAMNDDVYSVRTAAIDALGTGVATDAVGAELLNLLIQSDSPLVQLAVIDLILRNGNAEQLNTLLRIGQSESLSPELRQHVRNALGQSTTMNDAGKPAQKTPI